MLFNVTTGEQAPQQVNAIIEIPALQEPIKYEVDKQTGAVTVDRFMSTTMRYPCNYGYIPQTLAEDGDPTDILVITPSPIMPGAVVVCRPIGLLSMTDEAGQDNKVLALPTIKACSLYKNIHSYQDLPTHTLDQIRHFFEHYKDLEPDKWVKLEKWLNAEAAKQYIADSMKRYRAA